MNEVPITVAPPLSLAPGSLLGTHEIVGLLGAGGMGEVYRARDTRLNRLVAIKVLPEVYASDPDRVARFHREAQAVAALNHPNIATIYDVAEAGSTKFLVLELIEGETLADRVRRGAVPVEEALVIIKQVLEALEAAHERGICHRDLKPANIKQTPEGVIKVLDFGLAKFMQSSKASSQVANSPTLSVAGTYPGVILGTAGYMSPEQAKGHEADHRSDLFGVGCILYELLTGRQAFEGETASEILAGVLKSDVEMSRLPPRLNPRLTELLRRCLEKSPRKRWHAAADVRVEVESLMGRGTVVEEAKAAGPQPMWRRAAPIVGALLAGGTIAGAAVWMLKPEVPQPIARFAIEIPEGQIFSGPGRKLVAVSPDASQIVYAANNRLYLRALSGLEFVEIAGSSPGGVSLNPVFSPDGESIAFWTQSDATIRRIARGGGAPITVCKCGTAPYGMQWTKEGLVFGQFPGGIMRVSLQGGVPEVIAVAEAGEVASQPQMLPDGKAVVFAVRKEAEDWDAARIVVQELGGSRATLVDGGADPRVLPSGHLVFARAGTLLAVPFDASNRKLLGVPVPIIEGIRRGAQAPTGPTTGVAHFDYSANGVMVYVPGPVAGPRDDQSGTDLALFDFNGAVRVLGLPRRAYRSPRASRDGKLLTFYLEDDKDASVWTYEIDAARAAQRLTFDGRNRYPVWSSDGRSVFFQSDRDGSRAIFRQLADGSGAAQRLSTPEAGAEHIPHAASSDGMHVLFSSFKDKQWTLSVLDLRDRRVTAFGNVRSAERTDGTFSPDGKWIAYQLPGVPLQVFVQPFPATGSKYLAGVGGHPYWTVKGDAILVNAGPNTSLRIPFSASPRVAFGDAGPFTRVGRVESNPVAFPRNSDPMPNGTHFIGVATESVSGGDKLQLNVVVNWFAEVLQRVPRK